MASLATPLACSSRALGAAAAAQRSRALLGSAAPPTRASPLPAGWRALSGGAGRGVLRHDATVCAALSKEQAEGMMSTVGDGWELQDGPPLGGGSSGLRLARRYRTKNFLKALELCQRVGALAEERKHHPDLRVEHWNQLTVEFTTHSEAGVTEADFEMAAAVDALPKDDLLSKKKQL